MFFIPLYIQATQAEQITQLKGGYVPAIVVDSEVKPKNNDILKQVTELIEEIEAVNAPKALATKAKKVKTKTKQAFKLKTAKLKNQRINEAKHQIKALSAALDKHIIQAKDDEHAIQAILKVM